MLYEIVNIYQYMSELVDIVHNIVLVPFADEAQLSQVDRPRLPGQPECLSGSAGAAMMTRTRLRRALRRQGGRVTPASH